MGGVSCYMTTSIGQLVLWQYYKKNMLSYGSCHVTGHFILWVLSINRTHPPVILLKNMLSSGCCHVTGHVVLWMMSYHRTLPNVILLKICCPLDVVMSQDTLSYGCCHVTGHSPPVWLREKYVVLRMLSCHRTRFPMDVVMSQDTPPLFVRYELIL